MSLAIKDNVALLSNERSFLSMLKELPVFDFVKQVAFLSCLEEKKLKEKTSTFPSESFLALSGYDSIESLLCAVTHEKVRSWQDWLLFYESHQLRERYAIYEVDPVEIKSLYEDITSYLGREPMDEKEFHHVKSNLLIKQKHDFIAIHQAEIRELKSDSEKYKAKIAELMDCIESQKTIKVDVIENAVKSYIEQLKTKELSIIALQTNVRLLESLTPEKVLKLQSNFEQLTNKYNKTVLLLKRSVKMNKKLITENKKLKEVTAPSDFSNSLPSCLNEEKNKTGSFFSRLLKLVSV